MKWIWKRSSKIWSVSKYTLWKDKFRKDNKYRSDDGTDIFTFNYPTIIWQPHQPSGEISEGYDFTESVEDYYFAQHLNEQTR